MRPGRPPRAPSCAMRGWRRSSRRWSANASRVLDERAAAEAEIAAAGRAMAAPVPPPDIHLDDAVREAERELADALAELGALRNARQAQGQELAALRRAAATRQAERRDGAAPAGRGRTPGRRGGRPGGDGVRAPGRAGVGAGRGAHDRWPRRPRPSASRRSPARPPASVAERTDAERAAAHERAVSASARAAAVRAQVEGLASRLAEDEARGIARAARRVGGRRLDEDLAIDPPFRAAAEAALAAMTRAYVVPADSVASLAGERGRARRRRARDRGGRARRRARAPVPRGPRRGRWRDAGQRGPPRHDRGRATAAGPGRVAARTSRRAWRSRRRCRRAGSSPPATGRRSSASSGSPSAPPIRCSSDGPRPRGWAPTRTALDAEVAERTAAAVGLAAEAKAAADAMEAARADESRAAGARRAAEEAERLAARRLETVVREASWHEAQAERSAAELERARAAVAAFGADDAEPARGRGGGRERVRRLRRRGPRRLGGPRHRTPHPARSTRRRVGDARSCPSRRREPSSARRGVQRHRRGTDGARGP